MTLLPSAVRTDERHHDLRARIQTLVLALHVRFGDGADLQGEQAANLQAKTDAAQAEHRVLLMVGANRCHDLLLVGRDFLAALRLESQLDGHLSEVREELVERRLEASLGIRQEQLREHRAHGLPEAGAPASRAKPGGPQKRESGPKRTVSALVACS